MLLFILSFMPLGLWNFASAANTNAPSYENNFASYLTNWEPDAEWRVETVFDLWIDPNVSLKQNIRCLFYPNSFAVWCNSASRWWIIWDVLKYIWYWVFVLCIVLVWVQLLVSWNSADKVKSAFKSFWFIFIWALLFFGSIWILWSVLWVEDLSWSEDLVNALQWDQASLLFKVLSILKAATFFIAILMIVVNWVKMITLSDKADKAKAWFKWIVNVIVALAIIKVIDYIYYIAQVEDFATKAADFIMEIAKFLWFVIGAFLIIMIFYSWFLFITDQWNSKNMEKAKNIIIWVLLWALVLFMLLLIMYQIFAEFA